MVARVRFMRMQGEPLEEQERLAKAYAAETGADFQRMLLEAQKPGATRKEPNNG
jgi:hypothetical protein